MKLKLVLGRPGNSDIDIVVTADATATIGDIAEAIALRHPLSFTGKPSGPLTLRSLQSAAAEPVLLPPEGSVAESWLASGSLVTLVVTGGRTGRAESDAAGATAFVTIATASGTTDRPLRPGSYTVGRDPGCDIVIDDPLVSKVHARLVVSEVVEIVDLNSANGVFLGDEAVSRLRVTDEREVRLGDTTARVRVDRRSVGHEPGPIRFTRSPRVEPRYPGEKVDVPEVPQRRESEPFPWLVIISPIIAGIGLWLVSRNMSSLLFVALSPVLAAGNFLSMRQKDRRTEKLARIRFEKEFESLETRLETEAVIERERRLGEVPSTAEVYEDCVRLGPTLWTRRPEHWSFLTVRLGTGRLLSRNELSAPRRDFNSLPGFADRIDELRRKYSSLDGVPVIESLADIGSLGVVGEQIDTADLVRALIVHLTGLHAPSELSLGAIVGPEWAKELGWIKWLPHTEQQLLGRTALADSPARTTALLSELEALVDSRSTDPRQRGSMQARSSIAMVAGNPVDAGSTAAPPRPAVVVLIAPDADPDRDRLVRLSERAADAGVYFVWVERTLHTLPASCRAYLDLSKGRERTVAGLVRLGVTVDEVRTEGLDVAAAEKFARLLAPVVETGVAAEAASDLPRTVSIVTLLGKELVESSAAIVDRWSQNDSIHDRSGAEPRPRKRAARLQGIVGQAAGGAMSLDLRTQGPHSLVGGTTGAGKSEFLQAWVLGMAAEHSPDRVTFLYVDYKGGSAFAECVNLPHSVGLVTDLSPHLVRRALTSLAAELRHREHILNRKKAKDLLELERRGDIESPPALILVIDEFAALAKEVPDFVDGVVDIAQRGRSLGIHLIMATQRPAGVIKPNLRANTNLRIALRMADESDSQDVIDDKQAAFLDPALPGRGIAKSGPGRLAPFQSAYAGGWTTGVTARVEVEVGAFGFGGDEPWPAPAVTTGADDDADGDPGPTDQQRLVRSIQLAQREADIPAPRRPWLDELAPIYDLLKIRQRSDTEIAIGVVDVPDRQLQEIAYFRPDVEGTIAVFGTSGSGKSTVLRTLATAAGITPRSGPVEVYGLDFGSGGLRMLEALPHVGSVITGEDEERTIRLLKKLVAALDARSTAYSAVNAATITEYRAITGRQDEPRQLLLIDNFASFREQYEVVSAAKSQAFQSFQRLVSEGRPLGIHVALSSDRLGAVPTSLASNIGRQIVLRLADQQGYASFGLKNDILSSESGPGRAIVDGLECQVAVPGGSPSIAAQSAAITRVAAMMKKANRTSAGSIEALPTEIRLSDLPDSIDGLPVLGISDEQLEPIGFDPSGVLILGGPAGSGRTTALESLVRSVRRAIPKAELFYLGNKRSPLARLDVWAETILTPEDQATWAREMRAAFDEPGADERKIVIVLEATADVISTPAETPLAELVKALKRTDHFMIAEGEISTWATNWSPIGEIKSGRRGILLRPDPTEGETILKTTLPRGSVADFPPGRGFMVQGGKSVRIQIPLPT